MDFYCTSCELDQDNFPTACNNSFVFSIWEEDGKLKCENRQNTAPLKEWYISKCQNCKQELVRWKNNPHDPFFKFSKRVILQRAKYARDVIQYGESGFSTLYKNQWDKFETQREIFEKKKEEKKKERDEFLRKNYNNKQAAMKVLEIEEKLEA